MTNILLLLLVLLAANLPWFSNKFLYLLPFQKNTKNLAWCLLELVVLYFLMGFVAMYAEHATMGEVMPQAWEFYAVTACLFLVFSFPGFVYKVLWRKEALI
jgi:uncharacterized membrane protein